MVNFFIIDSFNRPDIYSKSLLLLLYNSLKTL